MKADKSGVTALEYGLIAALIAGVIVVGVTSVGTNLKSTFTSLANSI
jgi:pilus assembly protein Flp/PilA